jgi:hypothetical protein
MKALTFKADYRIAVNKKTALSGISAKISYERFFMTQTVSVRVNRAF